MRQPFVKHSLNGFVLRWQGKGAEAMNIRRIVFLLVAAVCAAGAAFVVRGMVGGGAPKAIARVDTEAVMTHVLVAAEDIVPGEPVTAGLVHWQAWPEKNVSSSFIVGDGKTPAANVIAGAVARSPIVKGEPISFAKVVKSGSAGFMAATLTPGMRAASIPVNIAAVAGGFIQPNDRVDVIQTRTAGAAATAVIVLPDVRVLAIDQAAQGKEDKPVGEARTVTLELTPLETQTLARAQAMGTLSLALRPIGENENAFVSSRDDSGPITIIRGSLGPQDKRPDIPTSGRN
jgi:pilus assembly protein CpaB